MQRLSVVVLVFLICGLIVGSRAYADPPLSAAVDFPDAAAVDPRLNKPVSIVEHSITLKSLLDEVSRHTGVDISIDPREASSSYQIFIRCDKLPVYKVMDALWSALSVQHREWKWMRTNKSAATTSDYAYMLLEPQFARDRTAFHHTIIRELLEKFTQFMQDNAALKPEERIKHKSELARILMIDDLSLLAGFYSGEQSEWFWSQAAFFTQALSREQQLQVLGGGTADVDLKSLPENVYALYHQHYLFTNATFTDPTGTVTRLPEATSVTFYNQPAALQSGVLAPMVMLKEHGKQYGGSWMGTGILQISVGNAVKHAWMLPGDSFASDLEKRVVKAPETSNGVALEANPDSASGIRPSASEVLRGSRHEPVVPLETRLSQVSQGANIPVIGVLPLTYQYRFADPNGQRASEFLSTVEGNTKHHMYKWRDGTLIVSYPLRFLVPSHQIPVAMLQRLEPDANGFAGVLQWAKFVSDIDDPQLKWLIDVLSASGDPVQLRSILSLIKRRPELLNETGAFLDTDTLRTIFKQGLITDERALAGEHTRVRIVTDASSNSSAGMNIAIQWRSDNAQYWTRGAFTIIPNLKRLGSTAGGNARDKK